MTGKRSGSLNTPVETLSFESDFDGAQPSTTRVHLRTQDDVTYAVRDTALSPSAYMSSLVYSTQRYRRPSSTEPLCLNIPSVKSDVFRTLLKYCYFHTSFFKNTLSDHEVKAWDDDFLNVDQAVLCKLAEGAYFLKISPLLDQACRAISNLISGKSTEEMQRTFNLKPDTSVPQSRITNPTSASYDTRVITNTSKKRKKKMRKSRIRRRKIRDESSENDSLSSAIPASPSPAPPTNTKSVLRTPSIPLHIRIRSAHRAEPRTTPSDPSSEDFVIDSDGSNWTPSIEDRIYPRSPPKKRSQHAFKTDPTLLDIPQSSQKRSKEYGAIRKRQPQQDSSSESEVQFVSVTLAQDNFLKRRDSRNGSLRAPEEGPHDDFVTQLRQTDIEKNRQSRRRSETNLISAASTDHDRFNSSRRASLPSKRPIRRIGSPDSSYSEERLPLSARIRSEEQPAGVPGEAVTPDAKDNEVKASQLAKTASPTRPPDESFNVQIARLEERRQNHLDRASQIDKQISQLAMEREKIRDALAVVTLSLTELRKQSQSTS